MNLPIGCTPCVLCLQFAVGQINVVEPAGQVRDLLLVLLLELLETRINLRCGRLQTLDASAQPFGCLTSVRSTLCVWLCGVDVPSATEDWESDDRCLTCLIALGGFEAVGVLVAASLDRDGDLDMPSPRIEDGLRSDGVAGVLGVDVVRPAAPGVEGVLGPAALLVLGRGREERTFGLGLGRPVVTCPGECPGEREEGLMLGVRSRPSDPFDEQAVSGETDVTRRARVVEWCRARRRSELKHRCRGAAAQHVRRTNGSRRSWTTTSPGSPHSPATVFGPPSKDHTTTHETGEADHPAPPAALDLDSCSGRGRQSSAQRRLKHVRPHASQPGIRDGQLVHTAL